MPGITEHRNAPEWRLALGLVATLGLLVLGLDHLLGRPDRVRYAHCADELLELHDALLRYEQENGMLPTRLETLVPTYLRADQMADAGAARYRYDRRRRVAGLAAPVRIMGLWPRHRRLPDISIPEPPALPLTPGVPQSVPSAPALFVPQGPPGVEPPAGALLFEAENYSETSYGWEVRADATAAGGAYLHTKEGLGNGPGQIMGHIYNFYDIREGTEFSFVKYHFRLAQPGTYFVYSRMWTTGSHCSNNVICGIDGGGPRSRTAIEYDGWSLGNQTPFRWLWTRGGNAPVTLAAGDHFLYLFPHEDGIRFDQFMLTPTPVEGDTAYRANLQPNTGTAFAATAGPAVHLSFDLQSMVITPTRPPECRLVLRRLRSGSGAAALRVTLCQAGPDGRDLRLGAHRLTLDALPELCFLPLTFTALSWAQLPRREYLLTAELLQDEQVLASTQVPLMRPYAWEVSGQLPYLANTATGPLDADATSAGEPGAWKPFADTSWDLFGVMDFGLQTIGNSLHAPESATIYVQTRIQVPQADTYLLKLQSDDQMRLWLDGREVSRNDNEAPVTRSVVRQPLRLEAGEHRLRMRVNQRALSSYGDGRWQASLRIRTREDLLSNVTGLSLPAVATPAATSR